MAATAPTRSAAAGSSRSTCRSRCSAAYIDYAMAVIVGRALPDVRDGLKPVHRRILYAMYDGGYRPDRGFSKCSRVVGDVMGQYHPHGDTAIYDTMVRLAQPWVMRAPLINGQGNFGSPGNDSAAAMRYTECRMAPLAMEMVRDIDEDTVDFQPNYDGRSQEPTILPARFPNLLVNGSAGIAVGMATNIPPHNLREVAEGAIWALEHPDATREELQDALIERIKGPDFPMRRADRRPPGHRAGLPHRSRLDHPARGRRDRRGRQGPHLPGRSPSCPTWSTRTTWRSRSPSSPTPVAIQGIADVRDDTSLAHRPAPGRRAQARRRRPRRAQQPASSTPSCRPTSRANMLALVDDVPRTLTIDQFISNWVAHQIEVIQRRTAFRLAEAEKRAHIYRGLVKALDLLDEVIALIRRSPDVDEARAGPDRAARHRRDAGQRDPRHAAASAGRPRAPEDHRRAGQDRARDRRPRGHPRQRGPPASDRDRRAGRDRREVRHRPPYRRSSRPTATCRWRT